MSPPPVDIHRLQELLERLEAHWRRVDAPILGFLQPGLEEAAVDAGTAPLGLRLPVEARVWYGWHDGARDPKDHERPAGNRTVGAVGYQPLPLARAVQEYRQLRMLDRQSADRSHTNYLPDDFWAASWFPLGAKDGEDRLAIACDVPDGAVAAVRHWDTECHGWDCAKGSLTDVVATWVWMLDEGLVYWDGSVWLPNIDRYDSDVWRRAASY